MFSKSILWLCEKKFTYHKQTEAKISTHLVELAKKFSSLLFPRWKSLQIGFWDGWARSGIKQHINCLAGQQTGWAAFLRQMHFK